VKHTTPLLLLAAVNVACGASYQRVYEGDVRFEHCYRLDADASVSSQMRLSCWSEWSSGHTAGQTLDRVQYARRREAALRGGDASTTGPNLLTGRAPSPPVATQALALNTQPTAAVPSPAASPSTASLSSRQQCSQECGQLFTECVTRCDQAPCAQKCGNQVKVCLEHCL